MMQLEKTSLDLFAVPDEFLRSCQISSGNAYDNFKQLLTLIENNDTRNSAVDFLFTLRDYFYQQNPTDSHFQFLNQTVLDSNDQPVSLELLQFPSTFLPEAWSFTFYEGLLRYPKDEFEGRSIVELGCGIGWITIALALRYSPAQIFGLDINPKAITCAKLNLYLNSINRDGSLKRLSNGTCLVDTVIFRESNLFDYFKQENVKFDRVVGCIPQVLNPEPEVMEDLIVETASDEYLHSLSNYFAKQGYIEDQFGLGLIARAVEHSIPLLESNGKLILNLGGRPGRSVLERLMQRRGFDVRRVWQTQVEQAADTEIQALVDIEKNTGHRFEFYMSANSDIPIDAQVALEYAKNGGKIFHSVDVYEASMIFPDQVKSIYKSVDQLGGESVRSAVDLTYENIEDAEERYSFLAYLAKNLQKINHFPYSDTSGLYYFRQQLTEFFRYYLQVNISEQELVITPGRKEMLSNLFDCYRPQLTLVAKSLFDLIPNHFNCASFRIMQTPLRVENLIELIDKLQPQMVITQLDKNEILSSQLVEQLIASAKVNNALLVLDLTDHIDLSSQPNIHGVYRYLSAQEIPDNLLLMAGLVNNNVYKDYSLNITVASNRSILKHLTDAADLTYSRTPSLKQLYYGHLVEQLLYFQRTRITILSSETENKQNQEFQNKLCDNAKEAFSHLAVRGNHLNFDQQTIRLDYGENELPSPDLLKEVLLESYLVRKWLVDQVCVEEPLQAILSQRFSFSMKLYSKVVLGDGVAPIFTALLNLCAKQQQRLVIPSGSYGYFNAAAELKGVKVKVLNTSADNDFKIYPHELTRSLSQYPGSWVFINAPIVNPTGAIYTSAELNELLNIASGFDCTVIMDSIFSGLEFDRSMRLDLGKSIDKFSQSSRAKFVLLGGLSKEFSAGGLRFGYAWSTSKALSKDLQTDLPHQPHFTLRYAVRKLLTAQLSQDKDLLKHQMQQVEILKQRAEILTQLLTSKGWHVIEPKGGLFLAAKPMSFIEEHQLGDIEGADLMTNNLFEEFNLVINNATWTGLPGYCRFVLSCSQQSFSEAIERLDQM